MSFLIASSFVFRVVPAGDDMIGMVQVFGVLLAFKPIALQDF